jgi:SNF2 family DNA or RNA helicase
LRSLSSLSGYGSIKLSDKEKEDGPLNRKWDLVIADEAHRIKDHKAKQTRALWSIGGSAHQRIALTGTPIANSPVDLWSIMHFVEPKDWPSRTKFIDRYCLINFNHFGGMDVVGLNARTEKEFFKILNPHFLRRTKSEVLKSLPDKTYQVRYIEMSTKQAKVYKEMETNMIAELESGIMFTTSPLVQVGRLNQIASAIPVLDREGRIHSFESPSCKVDAVVEILEEAPGQPLVVFAVNLALVRLLVESLLEKGIAAVRVTGEESSESRAKAVAQFQAGVAQVIVLTAAAGGEGLTLTAASRCVFVQHPWSHVQYTQAQDRLHRTGQKNAVQIIDLVTRDTVEERVLEVLANKEVSMQELCQDPGFVRRLLHA